MSPKRYTGAPCIKCGCTERYASSRQCVQCVEMRARSHRDRKRGQYRREPAEYESPPEVPMGSTPRQMRLAAEVAVGLRRAV